MDSDELADKSFSDWGRAKGGEIQPFEVQYFQGAANQFADDPRMSWLRWPKLTEPGPAIRRHERRPMPGPGRPDNSAKWKKAWAVIRKMRAEYAERNLDGETDRAMPTQGEMTQRLLATMKWGPSTRTIRKIVKAGEAGLLR